MLVKKLLLALVLLWPLPALAQAPSGIPAHTIPISGGPGVVGWKDGGPCLNGQTLIWPGVTGDPTCGTPSAGSVIVGTTPTLSGTPGDVLIVGTGPVLQQAGVTGTLGSIVQSVGPTIAGLTVTGSFTATGLVSNADLANSATTVNGQTCTLGSTCTAPAAAGTLTGATLAAGVTASSLTSFGNAPTITNPAITGTPTGVGASITINSTVCTLSLSCTISLASGATIDNLTVTTAFTATGLVTNADLVSAATTVNSQTCTLGASCTVTAAAGTLTGTTLNATVVTSSLTAVGTIVTGVWNGTLVDLAHGGTNANLVASNGGIVYSDASKLQILAGTVTASQCLLSGSNTAPTWGSCSGAAAVSSVADDGAGTLIISPTTGSVSAAINLANNNTITGTWTFTNSKLALLGSSTGKTTFTSANAGASNFTLTLPAVTSTIMVTGLAQTITAPQTFNDGDLILAGSSSGTSIINAAAAAGSTTMTMPAASTILAGLAITETFTAAQRGTPINITISTATFTPNFDTAQNFEIDLTSACPCTLANPSTTLAAGQSGVIEVHQDATGSRTIGTWGAAYQFVGGTSTITLSTAANAVDYLPYYVNNAATGIVLGAVIKNPAH